MCSLTTEEERAQRRAYEEIRAYEEMPRPRAPVCLLRAAWTEGTYANLLSAAGCEFTGPIWRSLKIMNDKINFTALSFLVLTYGVGTNSLGMFYPSLQTM